MTAELIPTDEERLQVAEWAGIGLTQIHIAALIRDGIDDKTLRKHFRKELDQGKAEAISAVASVLMGKALNGDTASIMFYLKTQAGWRETSHIDHTSSDGTMSPTIDASKLSSSTLEEILKAREGAENGLHE